MRTVKKGDRVSMLCMNGTVLRVNEWNMAEVQWDYGGKEWCCPTNLKPEREEWKVNLNQS